MSLNLPIGLRANWVLLVPILFLLVIGFVMLLSTSSVVGYANFQDSYFFIKKHILFLCIGFFAFLLGFFLPNRVYKDRVILLYCVACVLLVLTLVPGFGVKLGGAQRWLSLGPFRFQPVECIKFAIVVVLATALENKKDKVKQFFKGFSPILVLLGIPMAILAMQPDLGNIGLILLVSFSLFFLSAVPPRFLIGLASIGLSFVAINLFIHPYQMSRITSFLNPWSDPLGKNYHIIQSLTAVGSGGLTGLGIGESKLKYFYLPLQYSDFIFSIICEEGGLFLGVGVVFLFGMFLYQGFKVAKESLHLYGYYLAMGLLLFIVFQAIINISVVIGLMPVTGIPLTFISFGGTSLVTSLFYIGVILNVSRETHLKEHEFIVQRKRE
ncbi:putative lipid II flippase FtsW [Candidatus Marinamargulisbacteria bacterium SCGC AAA071-K20]|nr:putative lipid II flippase FtsW [Candidatus Marinamargulisbacteria bacterium SCGC AAA071-K20]